MQKLKKLFVMMMMLSSVFFVACSDDDDDEMSTEQAQAELTNLESDITGYVEEVQTSDGMTAINALMDVTNEDDPFSDNYKTSAISNIKKFAVPINLKKLKSATKENDFNFDDYVGTYTWNASSRSWDITLGEPSNKIIIKYPTAGISGATNNATLTLYSYEEVTITETDDYGTYTYTEPTEISADIYVNSTKVFDIDFSATWIASGDAVGEPSNLNVNVSLSPFTLSVTYGFENRTASLNVNFKYDGTSIIKADLVGAYGSSSMDDTPTNISGYIQVQNVKVEANVNAQNIENIIDGVDFDNPNVTEEQLTALVNEQFEASVSINGKKVGDIVYEFLNFSPGEDESYYDLLLVFKDGTTMSLSEFLTDLMNSGIPV